MKVGAIQTGVSFKKTPDLKANQNKNFNRYNLIPATGYASIGFGVVSGAFGYAKKIKPHKITGAIALVMAIAHVALLKSLHRTKQPKIKLA